MYSEAKSWFDAKTFCESQQLLGGAGSLVIDDDAETHSFLLDQGDLMWIGGSDTETEGTWKWVNGVDVDLNSANWASGEPNDKNQDQDCMVMNYQTDQWDDQGCTFALPFACQWNLGAEMIDGRLVRYRAEQLKNKAACSGAEERLIIANTEAINNWLATHSEPVWIGATDVEHEGQWKWSNGERVEPKNWIHWKAGGPDDKDRVEHCAIHENAKWDDRYCGELHAAACELLKANYCETSRTIANYRKHR